MIHLLITLLRIILGAILWGILYYLATNTNPSDQFLTMVGYLAVSIGLGIGVWGLGVRLETLKLHFLNMLKGGLVAWVTSPSSQH